MPCSCDGWELDAISRVSDRAERSEKELCRARAIVYRVTCVAEAMAALDPALRRKLHEEVSALLAHKKAEVAKDAAEVDSVVRGLESAASRIRDLGGEPGNALLRKIEDAKAKAAGLRAMSDEELLG